MNAAKRVARLPRLTPPHLIDAVEAETALAIATRSNSDRIGWNSSPSHRRPEHSALCRCKLQEP